MKKNMSLLVNLAAAACATLFVAACQTTTPGQSAVMCSKCKTVWVSSPGAVNPGRKGYIAYRDAKSMTCPECEVAADTYFKTGHLKHHCGHCGDTLVHCEQH